MHQKYNGRENEMSNRRSLDGFLVVAQRQRDTFPLRLCASRAEALGLIAQVDARTIGAALRAINQRPVPADLGVVSLAIIGFRDGQPQGCDVVRYWEGIPARVQLEEVWRAMGLRRGD